MTSARSRSTGTRVVHMVGYSHLDPVWLWPWTEGYAEARATMQSAVDRLGEYPEFVYSTTSSIVLDWIAESEPELFARVAELVRDGRIHLFGGWVVEADCNLPRGESLVRQALYGQRTLAARFGVRATVGGNPDSFGHAATLPKLLSGAGIDGYVFLRPEAHERALPDVFDWRADDGSVVRACHLFAYTSDRDDLALHTRRALEHAELAGEHLVFYGVGNHGGAWTRRGLDALRAMHAASDPAELVCSTPRAFVDATRARDAVVVVAGELQHHARGCYSAHARFKALHRRAEAAVLAAERWCTIDASLTGATYPHDDLRRAWRQLLLNEFHDTLAGTAIESAYEHGTWQLGETLSIAQRVANRALQRLGRRAAIAHEDDTQPLVVFNPLPWPVDAVVEHEVGGSPARMDLVDDSGGPVPLQWGRSEAVVATGRNRAVFRATLPPLGYRVHRLRPGECGVATPARPPDATLENEHLHVAIHPATGALRSLLHRATGIDVCAGVAGAHAVVLRDHADTWGHGVDAWRDVVGAFMIASIEHVEHGAARTVLRVVSRFASSTLIEDYALGRGARHVDVTVTLDWHERRRMLKLRYPTAIAAPVVVADAPYGTVRRAADGTEESMQQWVDVSGDVAGQPFGLTIANDGKHAYDAAATPHADIGITVARAVPYAHHDPAALDDLQHHRWLDLGEQRFRLRLAPHAGTCRPATAARTAAELDQPPVVLIESAHAGPAPLCESFACVDADNVADLVLKRAEADAADVVRIVERDGTAGSARVELRYRRTDLVARLGAHAIATLRVHDRGDVERVDLCEWTDDERPPGQPTPDGTPRPPEASSDG